jgi:hypothetical protein
MPISLAQTIICDSCGKSMVYNGTQTTNYLILANQLWRDANGVAQSGLPNAVPASNAFCDLACVKNYNPPTVQTTAQFQAGATNVSTSAG